MAERKEIIRKSFNQNEYMKQFDVSISNDERYGICVVFIDTTEDKRIFPDGQVVSSYNIETIIKHNPEQGLILYGSVEYWTITAEAMREVVKFCKSVYPETRISRLEQIHKLLENVIDDKSFNSLDVVAYENLLFYKSEYQLSNLRPVDLDLLSKMAVNIYMSFDEKPEMSEIVNFILGAYKFYTTGVGIARTITSYFVKAYDEGVFKYGETENPKILEYGKDGIWEIWKSL